MQYFGKRNQYALVYLIWVLLMTGPTKVDLVCRVWYPFFQKQTNNGWKAGRKTQMHELKIHLTLKINNRGRSAYK